VRAAAIVYLVSAIAVLSYGVVLLIIDGVGVGSLVFASAAGVLLVFARGLLGGHARACRGAFATSSFVAVGCFLVPLYLYVQMGWPAISGLWQIMGPLLAIAITHALALMFLFHAKPNAP
jgi:hypothetical protein